MKYIGIRGHRGAGKQTIAYLLGKTIDYLLIEKKKSEISDFNPPFEQWCDAIIADENIIYLDETRYVYFEGFGDTPKTFVSLLLGFDNEMMYDDHCKDNTIVNLKDFTFETYDVLPENIKCLDAEELYKIFSTKKDPSAITKDIYTTLRELIMYFGREVMQRYFGLNVWVKSLRANTSMIQEAYDKNHYKIFVDIKFPSEVSYIKENEGVMIKISRPSHRKRGQDKLSSDERYDYDIVIGDNLYDIKDTIIDIAKEIINR